MTRGEILIKLRAIGGRCVTCNKDLKEKELKKNQLRCKKCIRDYEKICPTKAEEFLKIFAGHL